MAHLVLLVGWSKLSAPRQWSFEHAKYAKPFQQLKEYFWLKSIWVSILIFMQLLFHSQDKVINTKYSKQESLCLTPAQVITILCQPALHLTWPNGLNYTDRCISAQRKHLKVPQPNVLELAYITLVMAWPDPIKNRRPRKPNSVQIAPLLHKVSEILNSVQKH